MNNKIQIKKHNYLNSANFDKFKVKHYRIFLLIISKLNIYDELTKKSRASSQVDRKISFFVSEFIKIYKQTKKIAYSLICKDIDFLATAKVFLVDTLNIENKYAEFTICEKVSYLKSEGKVEVVLSPAVMPYLVDVNVQFTQYELKEVANFKSIYTIRLYELAMQWKQIGQIKITLARLKALLGANAAYFENFKNFKKQLNSSIDEINLHFQLKLEVYKEERDSHRKVSVIYFAFKTLKVVRKYNSFNNSVSKTFIRPRAVELEKSEIKNNSDIQKATYIKKAKNKELNTYTDLDILELFK